MKDNRLIFTQGFIEHLVAPKTRTQHYDLKVQGLLLEIMPTGARIFRFRKKIQGKSQRVTIGRYPKISLEEARNAAIKLSGRLIDGEQLSHPKDELTLGDLANLYFDQYAVAHCVTHQAMRKDFNRYWCHIYVYKLSKINSECIQLGINKIAAKGHYRTANISLTLIRAAYNWGIRRKLVSSNPANGVDKFKECSRSRFLQAHEFEPLLNAINEYPDDRMRDFFLLCLYTGARSGNVKSMKWDQMDLKSGLWVIPRTKSGGSQTIQLSEAALDILKERAKTKELNPWVLPGGQHKPNTSHLQQPKIAWEIVKAKAGIKNLRIHDLRRTLASYMVMNNVSSATIMAQLGHRSLAAAQVYHRLDLKAAKAATDQAIVVMQQLSRRMASII